MNITMDYPKTCNKTPIYIVLFAIAFLNIVYGSHAIAKHSTVWDVRNCLDNQPPIATMYNPINDRHAYVCQLPNGNFGIMIARGQQEITSFVKDNVTKLRGVIHYLENTGFFLTTP